MSEQVRKEFEEFAARKHGAVSLGRIGDYYSCDNVRYDWIVWQASRAAIVVDTSSMPEASYGGSGVVYLSGVEHALEQAGVSYK